MANDALHALLKESNGFPIDQSVWSKTSFYLRNVFHNDENNENNTGNIENSNLVSTACSAVYWIEVNENAVEWAKKQPWFDNLTCQPSKNSLAPGNPKKFKVYYTHPSPEKSKFLAIPRFYGISMFGKAQRDLTSTLIKTGITFVDTNRPLRSYQIEARDKGLESLRKWGGAMLELDCGAGKTAISLSICASLQVKTLVICNRSFLMNQWKSDILGIEQWTWADDSTEVLINELTEAGLKNFPQDFKKRRCDICKKTFFTDETKDDALHKLVMSPCFNNACNSSLVRGRQWIKTRCPSQGWVKNCKVGWLQGKRIEIENCDIVVSSIDSLAEGKYSKDILSQFGLVIVDECHHIAASSLSQVMPQIASKYVLGVSATPERNDGLEHLIYWLLGPCAFVYKRLPSITGITKTVKIQQIIFSNHNDKSEAKTWNGQLAFAEMINRLSEDENRNDLLVKILIKCYQDNRRKILFVSSIVNHAKYISARVLESGLVPESEVFSIYGGTKQDVVRRSKTQDARLVFASYAYVGEGYDDAMIDTMVLALPRSSIQQIIGRCERIHDNKLTPIVYDIIDDFSIFEAMSYKRQKFYKSRGFECIRSRWEE